MNPAPTKIVHNKTNENKNVKNSGSESKVQSVDCSICMEVNESYVMAAAECGHIFHKECVTPWIQQAGTCPSCRVRISTASLRKIFVSVTSSAASNVNNLQKPTKKTFGANSHARENITKKTTPVNSNNGVLSWDQLFGSTSALNFSRSIYLSSRDRGMTEQNTASLITRLFSLTSNQFSVKSLKKTNAPQPINGYVSFKISVDNERSFNTLLRATKWPGTIRVREFIERPRNNIH